ncbi:hypothetical protein L228DRAFT_82163 [Xylona heveae TC161]|uniref:Protein prenylyltransferase n=1 Tax=Xylona heveae (strain CBS 132557 / TC161) TaxID=1328760 RepID=A0A165J499_XYLHT|nr:hypothetical protein L228DRAFT_82163 [Xylona heveae TC161]KZF25710.1 hypothetical protein L228DRAFT_82163 [Xylona heveae TC161]
MEQEIYTRISTFLERWKGIKFEFEILPSSLVPAPADGHLPIIEDGPSFGISKQGLIRAFCFARTLFFQASNGLSPDPCKQHDYFQASSIILLFDPEHLTAANARKKRLFALKRHASKFGALGNAQSQEEERPLKKAVHEELVFLESILTSPLHRHSKSPTLWYYRRWIYTQFYDIVWLWPASTRKESLTAFNETDEATNLASTIPMSELRLVMKAAERHPKNYYAWNYAREMIYLADTWRSATTTVFADSNRSDLYITFCRSVQEWCLTHASDTSGWSFLLFLLRRGDRDVDYVSAVPLQLVQEVVDLTLNFKWEHEAVWCFLRSVLASSEILSVDQREQLLARIRDNLGQSAKSGTENNMENDIISLAGSEGASKGTSQEKGLRWISVFKEDIA